MVFIEQVHRDGYIEFGHKDALPLVGRAAILGTMKHLNLPKSEYFVIGGANLVLRGIRQETTDLDMLVSENVFEQLSKLVGAEIHEPPEMAIARGADNQTVWVKNKRTKIPVSATTALGDGYYPMTFDSHEQFTEDIEGVNCLTLEHVRASKEALQRQKDVIDLLLIATFLGEEFELPEPTIRNPILVS